MEVIEVSYTVALRDFPDLQDKDRIAAETRYIRALERQLGGADAVAQALRTVLRLEESDGSDISAEDKATAGRWVKAANAAREAGYQSLGESEGAYFDVQLA